MRSTIFFIITVSDSIHSELRGFPPIGMLEYWKDGIMGLKEFLIIRFFPSAITTIPLFHHSIIPCGWHILNAIQSNMISMCYRNSETLFIIMAAGEDVK